MDSSGVECGCGVAQLSTGCRFDSAQRLGRLSINFSAFSVDSSPIQVESQSSVQVIAVAPATRARHLPGTNRNRSANFQFRFFFRGGGGGVHDHFAIFFLLSRGFRVRIGSLQMGPQSADCEPAETEPIGPMKADENDSNKDK